MKDTVIKGTGNSRMLSSVPNFMTLYPSYEEFGQALVAGILPVDLSGPVAAGCDVVGTSLNKANLLTDAVETAIWGSAANRTPNQALEQLRSLITTAQNTANAAQTTAGGKTGLIIGSYTGNGAERRTISIGITPKAVYLCTVSGTVVDGSRYYGGLALTGQPSKNTTGNIVEITTNGFIVCHINTASSAIPRVDSNVNLVVYHYIAFT